MFHWITNTLAQSGYLGVVLLMFLENIFPPIPSELIMPLAGFVAARGELSLPGVIAAGVLGSILGALPWYWAGRWLGAERLERLADRYGRWMTVSGDEVIAAKHWFNKHGRVSVLLGRLVPTVRTLISVPAGIVRMPLIPFLAYSTAGTIVWTGALAVGGFLLEGQYERVAAYVDPVSTTVVVAIVAFYIYRLVTYRRRR